MTQGRRKFKRAAQRLNKEKVSTPLLIPAILGFNYAGENRVAVATREGFVWCRMRDNLNEVVQAYNDRVSPVYELPVLVTRDTTDPSKYIVTGRDLGRYSDWGSSSYQPKHGAQHSFNKLSPGGDPVWVWGRQMMPLAAVPSGSSGAGNVIIQEGTYYQDKIWHHAGGTGTPDIVGLKPTDNTAKMVLVYLDAAGNPNLTAGLTFNASLTGTSQIVPYVPALSDTSDIPIAGVRLVSGSTIIGWNNIYDLRPWIVADGFIATGSAGHVIQEDSVSLDKRDNLNFVGPMFEVWNSATATNVSGTVPNTTFLQLGDTPSDYTDDGGKWLRVNAAEDAVEFTTGSVSGHMIRENGVDQTHRPALDFVGNAFNVIGESNSTIVSGSNAFRALDDTPASYSGEATKHAVVNAAEDALEFVDPLTIKEIDGNPTVLNVDTIEFTNGTVTDMGGGTVRVSISGSSGGGGSSTIYAREELYNETLLHTGTFATAIPSGYDHLEILYTLRSDDPTNRDLVYGYLNNDLVTANYRSTNIARGSIANVWRTSTPVIASTVAVDGDALNYSSGETVYYNINHPTNQVWSFKSYLQVNSSTQDYWFGGGQWENTDAITNLFITAEDGNLVSGSSVQVFGLKEITVGGGGGSATGTRHIIQDDSVDLTDRQNLNFVGDGLVAWDAGSSTTVSGTVVTYPTDRIPFAGTDGYLTSDATFRHINAWDENRFNLKIGTDSDDSIFYLGRAHHLTLVADEGDSTWPLGLVKYGSGSVAGPPSLIMYGGQGNEATPYPVLNEDVYSQIVFDGLASGSVIGYGWYPGAEIKVRALENFTWQNLGSEIEFKVAGRNNDATHSALFVRKTELAIRDDGGFYFGDPEVVAIGTWRIVRSGDDLVIQRREGSIPTPIWVTKLTIAA